jgi:hydrogenase maturation protein HypF
MALEGAAAPGTDERYPFEIGEGHPAVIDFRSSIRALVEEFAEGVTAAVAAAKFHATVAAAVAEAAAGAAERAGITDVALTGGVFQNRLLLGRVVRLLGQRELTPHFNTRVPANDAGISLGQAFLLRCSLND